MSPLPGISIVNDRYKRQVILPELGEPGQKSIQQSKVVVIGAGGLGCPALMYLTAAGIGNITIIDDDKIDESNLQRQILYTTADQGLYKAEIAALQLENLNPTIKVTPKKERLSTENAPELLAGYDVILDGTDNFETRYLVNDTANKLGIPVIFGAITSWEGQVSIFNAHADAPCYRCLYPQKPKADVRNCAEAGAIGPVAGLVGSLMALETIKLLVHTPALNTLTGKLWVIDGRTSETTCVPVHKNSTCVCADQSPRSKSA
jgi:adenylyltransferase/sulfurtransferase